jgi:hypothetical protein
MDHELAGVSKGGGVSETLIKRLEAAKAYLGRCYVLHPDYRREDHPHHSSYALVDVRATFARVRNRMRQQPSFAEAVAQVRHRLRLVHGRAEAA